MVGAETLDVVPVVADAATVSRRVEPTSALTGMYVAVVAPLSGTQAAPALEHRDQE
jgi:hypothetical protein